MKSKHLLWIFSLSGILLISGFGMWYPNGAPPAKTGSPGDGSDCTECHGGTPSTVTGWITSNIPASGYVPGQTYQITATNNITGSGKYGFEVSPQNAVGTLLGTLSAGGSTQLVGSNKYVTHVSANTTTNSWTFNWTAPVTGTGSVTFYGAFARNKPGPVRLSTLVVSEQQATPPGGAGPISGPSTVCKGTSNNYSVGAITNATSYVWSVPTGASITSGQGTQNITVNFGNSAVSGNVSVYGANAAGNGTPSNLAVTVNTVPAQPSSISGNTSPCEGTTQMYEVLNVAGVSYNWIVPSGYSIVSGQGTNAIQVTIGSAIGNIEVVPGNNCGNGQGRSIALTVGKIPGSAATPSGPDQVDLSLVSTSNYSTTGAPNATSYQWELTPPAAGTISGTGLSATVIWSPSFTGMTEIRVIGLSDCGEGSWSLVKHTEVINTTAINLNPNKDLLIYPNPSTGRFTASINGFAEKAGIRILDASGKELYSKIVNGISDTEIELQSESGIYFLIISDGTKSLTQKLFIRR